MQRDQPENNPYSSGRLPESDSYNVIRATAIGAAALVSFGLFGMLFAMLPLWIEYDQPSVHPSGAFDNYYLSAVCFFGGLFVVISGVALRSKKKLWWVLFLLTGVMFGLSLILLEPIRDEVFQRV